MRNKSLIFSVLGIVGVGAVAFFSSKSALRYEKYSREENPEKTSEKAKLFAKAYWPTGIAMGGTIFCIVFAQKINAKRIAMLAGTAAFLQQKYKKYREKVIEEIGPEKEQEIQTEIAKEGLLMYPALPQNEASNEVLFYDTFSGAFFRATVDRVKDAMYHINRMFQLKGDVSMAEFYEYIGIDPNDIANLEASSFGFDTFEFSDSGLIPWIDFSIGEGVTDNGEKYQIIYYDWEPTFLYEE